MASDLKIEIFAYDIFSKLFINLGITKPGILQIYGDECWKSNGYMEASDIIYFEAMLSRFLFFKMIYLKELTPEKIKSLKSLSDCYDYVLQTCGREDLFGHLSVFERMLATSAFVLTLCVSIYFDTTSVIDVLNFGHLLWATYFDKFTETFYKEGGWKELKIVAERYFMFAWSLDFFGKSKNCINMMKQASANYLKFLQTAKLDKYKHVTKHWIKFHINNFENYIIVPLNYPHSTDAYEGELLVEDLKQLCDPHEENSVVFKRCQTFDSFLEIKTVGNNTHYAELPENCSDLKYQSEDPLLSIKATSYNFNYINTNANLKCYEKAFFETNLKKANSLSYASHSANNTLLPVKTIDRKFGTNIGSVPDSIALNLDHSSENTSLNHKNKLLSMKIFTTESVERSNDTVSSISLFKKSETDSTKYVLSPESLNTLNKNVNAVDERLNINKDMDGTTNPLGTLSVDQRIASERSENTSPKHVFSSKCLDPENKYANTIYDRRETPKYIDDLSNHDDSVEIHDLLRMILILGDRQGIQYVLSTLHKSKSSPQNLKEKSIKRKKKPKKKTSGI